MDYIFVNTATGNIAESLTGAAKVFQPILAGGIVSWRVQFVRPASDGSLQEYNPNLVTLRASIGEVDARPYGGVFRIKVGNEAPSNLNTTGPLMWDSDPLEVERELNLLASRPDNFICDKEGDSYVIGRQDGNPAQLDVITSELIPASFADIGYASVSGRSLYRIKLKRAPLAFYDGVDAKLPNSPIITPIRDGYYNKAPMAPATWANEVQRLYVPPDFRGSYLIRKPDTLLKSSLLDRMSGIADIQAALNKMGESEFGSVIVTNPEANVAYIEFKSSRGAIRDGWGAANIPTLEVEVFSAPPPNYEINLNFSGPEIMRALGDRNSVELMFEAEGVERINASNTKTVKYWSVPITVRKPLIWTGLALEPIRNWQQRITPKNYVPFNENQVLIGQQQAYTSVLNGSGGDYVIDHNLSGSSQTPAVTAVSIKEIPTGRSLADVEYDLFHVSPNTAIVSIRPEAQRTRILSTGATEYLLSHKIGVVDYSITRDVPNPGGIDEDKDGTPDLVEMTFPPEFTPPGVEVRVDGQVKNGGYDIYRESKQYDYHPPGQARIVFLEGHVPPAGAEIIVGTVIPSGYLMATVIGYGPASAFQAHGHPIEQINELRPQLEGMLRRISALEAVGKTQGISSPTTETTLASVKDKQIILPSFGEILPDLVSEDSGTLSIASQLAASGENPQGANVSKPQIIEGTDLAAKQKEMQAQFDKYKADKDAELAALKKQLEEDAKKKAAETVKVKAAAESKTLDFIPVDFSAPAKRGAKYGFIMPAVSSQTTSLVSSLPLNPASGIVYQCASSFVIPGGGGRKSVSAAIGDKFCYSNGVYYVVSQSGGTFHPREMEVDLLRFMVSEDMLSYGTKMELVWNLNLSFNSSTILAGARYNLNVYATPVTDVASPAGPNIGLLSSKNLIFSQKVVLSRNTSESRKFELSITRGVSEGGVKTSTELKSYGKAIIGPDISNSQFLLNVRLEDWDIDDSTELPSGQISISMPKTRAEFVSAEVTT